MSIISANNLGVSYGADDIFAGISLELPKDAKVGLVGPNGVGKTTLLRLLAGITEPDSGSVHRSKGARIGYLYQEAAEALAGHNHSLWQEMLGAYRTMLAHADQLRALEDRMADGELSGDLLAKYGVAQEGFEAGGGYDYETQIEQTLEGLGFSRDSWEMPVSHLSGGQKTRALLARLLLERPDLLILDEPTNHLDVQAIEWLERSLRMWKGALIVASHDRYFLDQVAGRIWELSPSLLESYRGNYTAYVQQRQERWERNRQVYDSEMARLQQEMELIRRYIAWRKFEEAWGKLRLLSRKLMAIDKYGILGIQGKQWSEMGVRSHRAMMPLEEAHERIKHISGPPMRPPRIHLRLAPTRRGGDIVIRAKGLQVGYTDKSLLEAGDLQLERLERVALIGPNGAGKTTLLRTLRGELPPVTGTVELGSGLAAGYLAQTQDGLVGDQTVYDELMRHKNLSPGAARDYLARYLFRGDDVWKPVGALSGGERARLALAILTLEGVNVLLLDEPTNHLDIPAREVLEEALEGFEGTVVLVSHDRYLIDSLATQIWEIREGKLRGFPGTYREFLVASAAPPAGPDASSTTASAVPPVTLRPDREMRKHVRTLSKLEDDIIAAEALVAERSRALEGGEGDFQKVRELSEAYAGAENELEQLLVAWEELAEQIPAETR